MVLIEEARFSRVSHFIKLLIFLITFGGVRIHRWSVIARDKCF